MTLKVIHRLQAFSSAIRRTFVQHFTRSQLTACSRGPSATVGLLVQQDNALAHDPASCMKHRQHSPLSPTAGMQSSISLLLLYPAPQSPEVNPFHWLYDLDSHSYISTSISLELRRLKKSSSNWLKYCKL